MERMLTKSSISCYLFSYSSFSTSRIQGNTENYEKMKYWLQHTGSPLSKIERAEFVDEKTIEKFDFDSFSILP